MRSLSKRSLLRIAFAIPGAGVFIYLASNDKWTAAVWVLIVVGYVSGQGVLQIALMRGRSDGEWNPYDELRLEAAGVGVLGILFFGVGVALLCHVLSSGGNRYVIAGLSFVATIAAASLVIVTFKYPPARYRPYLKSKRTKLDSSSG